MHAPAALIIGLACMVITVLFVVQQFGTGAIGFLFSPIILTWLSFILGALPPSPASGVHASATFMHVRSMSWLSDCLGKQRL